jgi:hypothetical protein
VRRTPFNPGILKPGDKILYRPADLFDWVVAVKTWAKVSHIEIYAGNGRSVASRNGKGVGLYDLRETRVAAVLRSAPTFDLDKALCWFRNHALGDRYGWRTLLNFVLLSSNPVPGHQVCSEFAANFDRAGGAADFPAWWPACRTAPAQFLATRSLGLIWHDGDLF